MVIDNFPPYEPLRPVSSSNQGITSYYLGIFDHIRSGNDSQADRLAEICEGKWGGEVMRSVVDHALNDSEDLRKLSVIDQVELEHVRSGYNRSVGETG